MRTLLTLSALGSLLALCAQSPADEAYLAATAAYGEKNYTSAMEQVERALDADPKLAKAWKLRGDINQRTRSFEAAMKDYDKAEDLDPADVRLFVSRSALRLTEGNYRGAVRDADKAITLDPGCADAYSNKGWALYLSEAPDAALKEAIRAVRIDPAHAEALYLSGVVKGERRDGNEGLADIEAALRLRPDLPGGTMSMAVLLYESQRYEEAITKFDQVLATDSTEIGNAHFYRGHCYYELKRKDEACKDFTAAMRRGDKEATFIVRNYCNTEEKRIPRKPKKGARKTTIEF